MMVVLRKSFIQCSHRTKVQNKLCSGCWRIRPRVSRAYAHGVSQVVSAPIITLLTDFGTEDYFVGAMKGVMLTRCPEAVIVDITHAIPPQDVRAGALALSAGY